MEPHSSAAVAEHLLALSAPGLDGARSALEICCAAQTILRERVAELEQELNSKKTTMSPPEVVRLVECGRDPLLIVCLFLVTKEKARFRTSSLGLHSALLGCAIDLTESEEIRDLATIEFVLEKIVPFRMFSNSSHEACSCAAARTISGLGVGACLRLAAQHDAAYFNPPNLHSIGFGRSWSVVGLSLLQESDAEMLPELLSAIQPNKITKVAIGVHSAEILTAIGQAVEKSKLPVLDEIKFHTNVERHYDEDFELGTISNFGPAFRHLDLASSQIISISGIETCKNLRTLNLACTSVTDVSALWSCSSLRWLHLGCTAVTDVSALGSCSKLRALYLSFTEVTDVSALGSCSSLRTLHFDNTAVTDVSALGSCSKLCSLDLSRTQVTDVSALGSCSRLRTLNLIGTAVTDVSALEPLSALIIQK